ncbi:uncharacterized protein CTRU02_212940 [Colletotrichum truncatum]|uniref:Uncharacterized protein n=1 Tax=Colletotrichum truncatum TaxID=5467 RepID=A0ACC3YJI6_COLTU|nr:uncharacterized protein CTRU02_03263 [Colletotrichum truncatum]KAF6797232.1 hypothetical protein CTRU02_03263 [Colletotrichum truncatum]
MRQSFARVHEDSFRQCSMMCIHPSITSPALNCEVRSTFAKVCLENHNMTRRSLPQRYHELLPQNHQYCFSEMHILNSRSTGEVHLHRVHRLDRTEIQKRPQRQHPLH